MWLRPIHLAPGIVAMLLCTTCTLPFLMSFNILVRKLSMSILVEMLLGREFHALIVLGRYEYK